MFPAPPVSAVVIHTSAPSDDRCCTSVLRTCRYLVALGYVDATRLSATLDGIRTHTG